MRYVQRKEIIWGVKVRDLANSKHEVFSKLHFVTISLTEEQYNEFRALQEEQRKEDEKEYEKIEKTLNQWPNLCQNQLDF